MTARAAIAQPGLLPIVRTRLIGREDETAAGRGFLLDDAVPLLTLTGPGGVGKTRLALALAETVRDAFADGAVWVDLTPLAGSDLIPATVVSALGLVPASDQPAGEELARYLRPRQTLLVLDNCEHLLGASADLVSGLLAACPALQVLATSRAPLRIRGEQLLPVEPLLLPPGDDPTRSASLSPVLVPCARPSPSPKPTRPPWRRSSAGSMAYRWRSNWPRPAREFFRRKRCWRR
jgi:hypothetical protein